jgi:uncharacterized membrane protein YphA (DoxX/SURF4 family)
MDGLLKAGRIIFATALVLFGVQFFIFLTAMTGPAPGPPWTHKTLFLDWLACAGFVLAGVSIATGKMARSASILLGAVLLLYALFRYVPIMVTNMRNPGPWTVVFEILALVGGAWILAAALPADGKRSHLLDGAVMPFADVGRYLIAVALAVFAAQHFIYAGFVATIVPAWIPARLFWAYFTGAAFVAAALAIVSKKMLQLAAMLLGTMFLLWVVVLHIPRVAGAVSNGNEVTSLFVAVAMCGVSFILAGASGNRLKRRGAR